MDTPTPHPIGNFDPQAMRCQLKATAERNPEGNGYIAVVVDTGPPHAPLKTPKRPYNSAARFDERGIFPNAASALHHAKRWVDAHIARLWRIEQLREERRLDLADRLYEANVQISELRTEVAEHKESAKTKTKEIEKLEGRKEALIKEARDPQVTIDFGPSSEDFRLYDQPAESDGTIDEDPRQVKLALDEDQGERSKPSGKGKDKSKGKGRRNKPKSESKDVANDKPAEAANDKPNTDTKGPSQAQPGLDPNAVRWPKDENSPNYEIVITDHNGRTQINGENLDGMKGDELDRLAADYGAQPREDGENDASFRARIETWARKWAKR